VRIADYEQWMRCIIPFLGFEGEVWAVSGGDGVAQAGKFVSRPIWRDPATLGLECAYVRQEGFAGQVCWAAAAIHAGDGLEGTHPGNVWDIGGLCIEISFVLL
jgi:hypothetical protein